MTIDAICQEIMDNDSKYMQYLKKIPENWRDDLLGEVFIILLEKPDRMIKAYKEKWLLYLWVNICQKQFHSSTSPFYKKYRQINSELNESVTVAQEETDNSDKELLEYQWELVQSAKDKVKLTWFEDRIATQYFDNDLSMAKVAKENDISTASIFNCVHRILDKYKEYIENKINQ